MSRYPNNASSIVSIFAKKKNRLQYLFYGGIGFVIVIYCLHYLSLTSTPTKPTPSTAKATLPHVDYLDSSQLVDNEDLDRFLFQDAVPPLTTNPSYGHSNQQLEDMIRDISAPPTTITALLQASPTATFYAQLGSVLHQSFPPSSIWLACSPNDQQTLQQHIQSLPEKDIIHLLLLPPSQQQEKNDDAWMTLALQSDADYVWILDSTVLPGNAYLERLIKLYTTPNYNHALLGTSAYNSQQCMDTSASDFVTSPAQRIDGLWLLARSWLTPDLFNGESSGHVISDYLNHIGITPIALPLTTTNQQHWHDVSLVTSGHVCPTKSTEQQQQENLDPTSESSLVFLVDQWDQFKELVPLICHSSSSSSKRVIHILPSATRLTLTQEMMKNTLLQHGHGCTPTFNDGAIIVHTSAWLQGIHEAQSWHLAQHIMQRLTSTLSSLKASVLIHTLRPSDPISDSVAAISSSSSVTVIALPARDIQHVQWMMDLPMIALENWHKGKIQLMVTTDRNPYGLTRLLRSATKAHYMGDKVDLTIIMDQSSDRVTQQFAHDFSWHPHGEKQLRHRIVKMNRMPVFVESWYPRDSYDDYAILLHDDVDVSSLYYVWAKQALLHYRYSTTNDNNAPLNEAIMGISLYTPRLIDTYVDGRQLFTPSTSTTTHPYLMQAVTNGGTLFFPEHWREFHDYVTARYADIKKKQLQTIEVPLARSANWTHSWRRYMDELMYLRGYMVIYPFVDQGQQSFSTHYLDIQHHDAASGASDDDAIRGLFQVPLVQDTNPIADLASSDVDELALFDLWGQPVGKHAELLERGWSLQRSVSACPPPSRLSLPVFDPADLLCPFARIVDVPVDQVTTDILPTRVATLYVTNPTAPTAV